MKIEMEDSAAAGPFGMSMDTTEPSSPIPMNEDSSSAAPASFQGHQLTTLQQQQQQHQQPQQQQQQPMTEDDIFRSMKINDTSKTPYSDATQVNTYVARDSNVVVYGAGILIFRGGFLPFFFA